jgi:hypothetical protein
VGLFDRSRLRMFLERVVRGGKPQPTRRSRATSSRVGDLA